MEKQKSYFHGIFQDRPWLLTFCPWPCFLSWFISKGHWIHGMLIAVLVEGKFFGKPLLQPWQRNNIYFKQFTSNPLSRSLAIRQSSKQAAFIPQYAEEQLCPVPPLPIRHISDAALAFHPLLPASPAHASKHLTGLWDSTTKRPFVAPTVPDEARTITFNLGQTVLRHTPYPISFSLWPYFPHPANICRFDYLHKGHL